MNYQGVSLKNFLEGWLRSFGSSTSEFTDSKATIGNPNMQHHA